MILETLLPDGRTKKCKLNNVLLVPKLSYSLLSVSKASSKGKTTRFDKKGCEILNEKKEVIAFATRVGNLYHLEHCAVAQTIWTSRTDCKGETCQTDDAANKIGFCETCVGGKHHCSPCTSQTTELVHSDVCGNIQEKSLGGAEYFLTFTDDKTRYTCRNWQLESTCRETKQTKAKNSKN